MSKGKVSRSGCADRGRRSNVVLALQKNGSDSAALRFKNCVLCVTSADSNFHMQQTVCWPLYLLLCTQHILSVVGMKVSSFPFMCLHFAFLRLFMAMRTRKCLLAHSPALKGRKDTGQKGLV